MKNMEILAPVGSADALTAAVRSGADAVYLATTRFGARASAKNFDTEQLKSAVTFCHQRDVKVYLTMNTLLKDTEMSVAIDTAKNACRMGIDALIVQDVGFADVIRKSVPDLPLHASTQMSIHTPKGAELLYRLGFKRVVLARELSREEIREIVASCPIETEVFVHGALCMCVSGQCYFSSVLGGRSGNRGQCAQTCRLPFSVEGGNGHDLSLKDMSVLEKLRELQSIGVTSAKIEGRLKRPEYVASAVNVARQFLDSGYADKESCLQLKNVFSRSGFTDGYYTAHRGRHMFGIRQKEDVLSASTKVLNQIHAVYKNEYQRIPVEFCFSLAQNSPAHLTAAIPEKNISVECFGDNGEIALTKPITAEKITEQLLKTGNSPFKVSSIACNVQEHTALSLSAVNRIRRDGIEQLTEKLMAAYQTSAISEIPLLPFRNRTSRTSVPLRAVFSDWDIPDEFLVCELIFVPENTPLNDIEMLMRRGFRVGMEIFGGMFGRENQIQQRLKQWKTLGIEHILINNLGAIPLCEQYGLLIHGNFRMNVMNTQSVSFFKSIGLCDVTASFELTAEQINALGNVLSVGAILYGKLPLMLTRNCPGVNSATKTCRQCGGSGFITDRKNIDFLYRCNGGCTQIFNSVPLYMGDRKKELSCVDFYTLFFTDENHRQKTDILHCVRHGKKIDGHYTRGLYDKGVL